jgi:hypothetical protein
MSYFNGKRMAQKNCLVKNLEAVETIFIVLKCLKLFQSLINIFNANERHAFVNNAIHNLELNDTIEATYF